MKKHLLSTIFGTVLAVGAVASFGQTQSASAMTLPITLDNNASESIDSALPVTEVQYNRNRAQRRHHRANRRHDRRRTYRSNRHGPRYSHRRGRNQHYYNGFWYAVPFWLGATTYRDPYYAPRRGSRHVRWCLNRYRSYRLSTDTFRGYDGYDHLCRSPYRR